MPDEAKDDSNAGPIAGRAAGIKPIPTKDTADKESNNPSPGAAADEAQAEKPN